MHHLCKMLGKKVNDPEIVDMDDITWAWHFAGWLEDQEEEIKIMRSFGCFVGSFINPEAARKIQDMDDDKKSIGLSEEEFDASSEYVRKLNEEKEKQEKTSGKRKKKKLRIKK